VDASHEEVETVVVFDDVGVVGNDIALVGEGVLVGIGEEG
jgi:predicted Zn-dependent protease